MACSAASASRGNDRTFDCTTEGGEKQVNREQRGDLDLVRQHLLQASGHQPRNCGRGGHHQDRLCFRPLLETQAEQESVLGCWCRAGLHRPSRRHGRRRDPRCSPARWIGPSAYLARRHALRLCHQPAQGSDRETWCQDGVELRALRLSGKRWPVRLPPP